MCDETSPTHRIPASLDKRRLTNSVGTTDLDQGRRRRQQAPSQTQFHRSRSDSSSTGAVDLTTGCSEGGAGAALAMAFHKAGHHVYATARNPSKLGTFVARGIKILTLDITSTSSITSAVASLSSSLPKDKGLDMLVNNAAGNFTMHIADVSVDAVKDLYDLNIWSQVAVTQAFLPVLLKPLSRHVGEANFWNSLFRAVASVEVDIVLSESF